MPTTAELLNLTPQEVHAAAFTASGEAGPGKDLGGVLQTILARKARQPGASITNLVTAPQQFVANDRYSTSQVTDPNYGSKIYGSRYQQAVQTLQNPNLMAGYLQAGQGATSFRGQSLLGNKQPGDYMFDPKGNFYFDKNPAIASSLIKQLGQPAPLGIPSATTQSTQSFATGPQIPPPLSPPPVPTEFLNTFVNALNTKPTKEDDGLGGLTQPFISGVTAPMLVSVPGTQQMVAVTPQTLTPEYQELANKFIAGR
jgi:hypothetical protein